MLWYDMCGNRSKVDKNFWDILPKTAFSLVKVSLRNSGLLQPPFRPPKHRKNCKGTSYLAGKSIWNVNHVFPDSPVCTVCPSVLRREVKMKKVSRLRRNETYFKQMCRTCRCCSWWPRAIKVHLVECCH